ncbi:hypothetical protein FOZ63_028559 [Perkinsus olseni]|uniref:Uncharacterized protein n=1 Tax=Perkinsus olseni TaxID=32597 RepID=A0A7J6RIB2_PEROL|nr:hypothetical protein FOZ63_028559 [Perkinsus olseni]
MLTPEEDDDWVYQRGLPSTRIEASSTTPPSPSRSSTSPPSLPSSKRRYEANLNYRITFCENKIVIRHGGNLDVALVLPRDKIGEGKEMVVSRINSDEYGAILQEITACAVLGTMVVNNNTAFLVLVSDAIPVSKLPGGHVVMEVTKLSDSSAAAQAGGGGGDASSSSSSSSSTAFALVERVEK